MLHRTDWLTRARSSQQDGRTPPGTAAKEGAPGPSSVAAQPGQRTRKVSVTQWGGGGAVSTTGTNYMQISNAPNRTNIFGTSRSAAAQKKDVAALSGNEKLVHELAVLWNHGHPKGGILGVCDKFVSLVESKVLTPANTASSEFDLLCVRSLCKECAKDLESQLRKLADVQVISDNMVLLAKTISAAFSVGVDPSQPKWKESLINMVIDAHLLTVFVPCLEKLMLIAKQQHQVQRQTPAVRPASVSVAAPVLGSSRTVAHSQAAGPNTKWITLSALLPVLCETPYSADVLEKSKTLSVLFYIGATSVSSEYVPVLLNIHNALRINLRLFSLKHFTFLHNASVVTMMINSFKSFHEWDRTVSQSVLELICDVIFLSSKMTDSLIKDFSTGYTIMQSYLTWVEREHFKNSTPNDLVNIRIILQFIRQLLHAGTADVHLNMQQLSAKYNAENIKIYQHSTTLEPPLRNLDAMKVLTVFALNSDWSDARVEVLKLISAVFNANPRNYFLVEPLLFVPEMIKKCDTFSPEVKSALFAMISSLACDLRLIPYMDFTWMAAMIKCDESPLQISADTVSIIMDTFEHVSASNSDCLKNIRALNVLNYTIKYVLYLNNELKNLSRSKTYSEKSLLSALRLLKTFIRLDTGAAEAFEKDKQIFPVLKGLINYDFCRKTVLEVFVETIKRGSKESVTVMFDFISFAQHNFVKERLDAVSDVLVCMKTLLEQHEQSKSTFRDASGSEMCLILIQNCYPFFEFDPQHGLPEKGIAIFHNICALIVTEIQGSPVFRKYLMEIIRYEEFHRAITQNNIMCTPHSKDIVQTFFDLACEVVDSKELPQDRIFIVDPKMICIAVSVLDRMQEKDAIEFLIRLVTICKFNSNAVILSRANVLSVLVKAVEKSFNTSSFEFQRAVVQLFECLAVKKSSAREFATFLDWVKRSATFENPNVRPMLLGALSRMMANGDPTPVFDMNLVKHKYAHVRAKLDKGLSQTVYSFSMWVWIDSFGENSTPITFMQIGKDKTKTGGEFDFEPSAVFEFLPNGSISYSVGGKQKCTFPENIIPTKRWTHIVFVNRKVMLSSTAILYVDGNMVWSGSCSFHSASSPAVVVVGGTKTTESTNFRQHWIAGPTYLFEKMLTHQFVFGLYSLGPRFCDSLLQNDFSYFRTYENFTHEMFAVAEKAFTEWKEDNLEGNNLDQGTLSGFDLSDGQTLICLSGSYIDCNDGCDAAASRQGMAFAGDCVPFSPCVPKQVLRVVGGVMTLFPLLEDAEDEMTLNEVLSTICSSIRHSPANLRAMEESNGYQIVSSLLSKKGKIITSKIEEILLTVCGISNAIHQDSRVISNMQAFKSFFANYEIWRDAPLSVTLDVIQVLTSLVKFSVHKKFNAARMNSVQTLQHYLLVLREESLAAEIVPKIVEFIGSLCEVYMKPEHLSLICNFASSLLPSGPQHFEARPRVPPSPDMSEMRKRRSVSVVRSDQSSTPQLLRHTRLCGMFLRTIIKLLISPHEDVKILSRMLTPKWIFHFIHKDLPDEIVPPALQIFCIQYAVHGKSLNTRFVEQFNAVHGFSLLDDVIPHFCYDADVCYLVLALIMGKDVRCVPDLLQFSTVLFDTFAAGEMTVVVPDALPIFFHIIKKTFESRSETASRRSLSPQLEKSLRQDNDMRARGKSLAPQVLRGRGSSGTPTSGSDKRDSGEFVAPRTVLTNSHRSTTSAQTSVTVIQQTLVKLLMPIFLNCRNFRDIVFQPFNIAAFISIFFPKNRNEIPADSFVSVYQILNQMLGTVVKEDPRGMSKIEPIIMSRIVHDVPQEDLLIFQTRVIIEMMDSIEPQLSIDSFAKDTVFAANLSRFCLIVASKLVNFQLIRKEVAKSDIPTPSHARCHNLVTQFLIHVARFICRDTEIVMLGAKHNRPEIKTIYTSLNRVIIHIISDYVAKKEGYLEMNLRGMLQKVNESHGSIFLPLNTDPIFHNALMTYLQEVLAEKIELKDPLLTCMAHMLKAFPGIVNGLVIKNPNGSLENLSKSFMCVLTNQQQFLAWFKFNRGMIKSVVDQTIGRSREDWAAKEKEANEQLKYERKEMKSSMKSKEKKAKIRKTKFLDEVKNSATDNREAALKLYKRMKNDEIIRTEYIRSFWKATQMKLRRFPGVWNEYDNGLTQNKTMLSLQKWRLDFTEGPLRMRRKFEPDFGFYTRFPFQGVEIEGGKPIPTSLDSKVWFEHFTAIALSSRLSVAVKEPQRQNSLKSMHIPSISDKRKSIGPGALTEQGMRMPVPAVASRGGHWPRASMPKMVRAERVSAIKIDDPVEEETIYSDEDSSDDEMESSIYTSDLQMNDDDEDIGLEDEFRNPLKRFLNPEDEIEASFPCSLAEAMDTSKAVISVCTTAVYLIEGFTVVNDEIQDISAEAGNIQGGFDVKGAHTMHRWPKYTITQVVQRRYALQWVALEVFLTQGQTILIVFDSPTMLQTVYTTLKDIAEYNSDNLRVNRAMENKAAFEIVRSTASASTMKKLMASSDSSLADIQMQWVEGKISNFFYLMTLNTYAGRSYNDISQYPVFPWVIADYRSKELDLTKPETFRDLSKPMGAMTKERVDHLVKHYRDCQETNVKPFHYSHHYSSPAVTGFFLVRIEPFTKPFLDLNGGRWDVPDRLFSDVGKLWDMLTSGTTDHVMELTPEFFYLPDFLMNKNKFNFGFTQGNASRIDNIILPPWAHGSPRIFVQKNMEALESPYVSAHLNEWIDLIFGYKQKGPAAEKAINVFVPSSYEENVNIDSITDEVERLAEICRIKNFGQTPLQLFSKGPHPKRNPATCEKQEPPLWATYIQKMESSVQRYNPNEPVNHIYCSTTGQLLAVTQSKQLYDVARQRRFEYDNADFSVRFFSSDKLQGFFYPQHYGRVLAADVTENGDALATTSYDGVIKVFAPTANGKTYKLVSELTGRYMVHHLVKICEPMHVILSGSTDGTCTLWDLNKLVYVRDLDHGEPVTCMDINPMTGDVATCSAKFLKVWTINGEMLAEVDMNELGREDEVTACCFSPEWIPGRGMRLVTGHRNGNIRVWDMERFQTRNSKPELRCVTAAKMCDGRVTALHIPSGDKTRIYAGTEKGDVFTLVDSEQVRRKK